ncbi:MAG TPA: hypothetical protein VFB67_02755 [Candidatus Polarisedimenticolaceae bacterium]|nr:hypothetical protein [Candidatus Polarisedimenticolaceae bacterium]
MRVRPLATGVLLAAAAAAAAAPAPPAPSAQEMARLGAQNAVLQKQLDLAKGKEFYLVLDPQSQTLKLMYRAALLQEYRVAGLEVGVPRVLYRARSGSSGWEGRIWEKGTLDPGRELDRVEMQAPPPTAEGTELEVTVPPTPEEKYPVPARYHIRFDGGLSIEVRPPTVSDSAQGFWARITQGFASWWADARAASRPAPTDTVRLHVVLSRKDAESLYRALPPNTRLLVVPPQS